MHMINQVVTAKLEMQNSTYACASPGNSQIWLWHTRQHDYASSSCTNRQHLTPQVYAVDITFLCVVIFVFM